jgi:hypothetical protein
MDVAGFVENDDLTVREQGNSGKESADIPSITSHLVLAVREGIDCCVDNMVPADDPVPMGPDSFCWS